MSLFQITKEGVLISLRVIPGASWSEVVGIYGQALKVKIKAPPVDGQANAAIIDLFSGLLKISKAQLEITQGGKSKSKSLLVRGLSPFQIESALEGLLK